MRGSLILLFIMLVQISAESIAGRGGGGRSFEDGMFWGADLDRNARIDRDEAKAVKNLADDEIFERYDKNGNGSINRAEFYEFIQQAPWTDKFVHPSEEE